MLRIVWAGLGEDGRAVRIFKNQKIAVQQGQAAFPVERRIAVSQIRRQIWERDCYTCAHCGQTVTWDAMELHERIWRGRGGEVSVDNGVCLCASCHADDPVAGHGKRKVQWSV